MTDGYDSNRNLGIVSCVHSLHMGASCEYGKVCGPFQLAGLTVQLTIDALPGDALQGIITAINPDVGAATGNIHVQALVDNSRELLRPGMYHTWA